MKSPGAFILIIFFHLMQNQFKPCALERERERERERLRESSNDGLKILPFLFVFIKLTELTQTRKLLNVHL